VPFVAPPGIRWVRIDRASGKPVYGTFPTNDNDPKAEVIWEAFQPQTEAVHGERSALGDPYSPQYLQLWQQQAQQAQQANEGQEQQQHQPAPGRSQQQPAPVATPPEPKPSGLPTQNTL
jgi:penicillin-binding protein 1A